MDEELLYQSLKRLENQEDRALFREMSKVFGEVVRYSREQMERLEDKLSREWKDPLEKRYLYGTVMKKEEAALADHLFFPMVQETGLESDGETQSKGVGTLFLTLSEKELQACLSKTHFARFTLRDGAEQGGSEQGGSKQDDFQRVEVRLVRAERYRRELDALRKDFYYNRIFFGNANLPYLDKFVDVIPLCEKPWMPEDILNITVEGMEQTAEYGMIPLWNVKMLTLPCAIFPIPAADTSYFEHELVFPAPEDGYVVFSDPEIYNIFYRDNTVLLWSKRELSKKWKVFQIVSPMGKEVVAPHLPVTTNRRGMTDSDRQAESAVRLPRTRGEILRITKSYTLVSCLEADEEIEVLVRQDKTPVHIRFKVHHPGFIEDDEIRFLLEELDFFFPELKFEGSKI